MRASALEQRQTAEKLAPATNQTDNATVRAERGTTTVEMDSRIRNQRGEGKIEDRSSMATNRTVINTACNKKTLTGRWSMVKEIIRRLKLY